MIYLQKTVIDHIEYSISLGRGVVKEPESSIDLALLVEGALLKEHALIAKTGCKQLQIIPIVLVCRCGMWVTTNTATTKPET